MVEHNALGALTWDRWEYPIGASNLLETDVGGHELITNVEVDLVHEPTTITEMTTNRGMTGRTTSSRI